MDAAVALWMVDGNVIQKCVSVPSFEFLPCERVWGGTFGTGERRLEIGNRQHPVFSSSQRRFCEERVAAKRERVLS